VAREGKDWIDLSEDRDRWQALVHMAEKLRDPYNAPNFLSSLKPVSFSGKTVFNGFS
jgi:hypothetical protein